MLGTFQPGDKLIFEKIPFNQINKGDVIIFRRIREDQSDFIVHRVAGITAAGLVTRGDNCFDQDTERVSEKDLIGRVIRYDRSNKILLVCNGDTGQMRAAVLHGRLHAVKWFKYFLRKPYLTLRRTELIEKIWHPNIESIHFNSLDGPFIKYLHKGKTVAISRGKKRFSLVKRPFDFIFQNFPD